jgi:hypothetical protein
LRLVWIARVLWFYWLYVFGYPEFCWKWIRSSLKLLFHASYSNVVFFWYRQSESLGRAIGQMISSPVYLFYCYKIALSLYRNWKLKSHSIRITNANFLSYNASVFWFHLWFIVPLRMKLWFWRNVSWIGFPNLNFAWYIFVAKFRFSHCQDNYQRHGYASRLRQGRCFIVNESLLRCGMVRARLLWHYLRGCYMVRADDFSSFF